MFLETLLVLPSRNRGF